MFPQAEHLMTSKSLVYFMTTTGEVAKNMDFQSNIEPVFRIVFCSNMHIYELLISTGTPPYMIPSKIPV